MAVISMTKWPAEKENEYMGQGKEYPVPEKIVRTVKEMDEDQQPREKAEKYGVEVLSVPELWAIVLRTGTPGYPITELCRDLMRLNDGSLHKLERRAKEELCQMRGIGPTKAIEILAVMQLIRKYIHEDIPTDEPIRTSSQIYERMRHIIGNLDHEEIWMLLLNRQNKVIKQERLTSGTSISSVFDTKSAIKKAILENSEAMILCHNHPSGALRPSAQDDNLTRDLKEACRFMGIRLLDHVIVTPNGFYSYMDSGKL